MYVIEKVYYKPAKTYINKSAFYLYDGGDNDYVFDLIDYDKNLTLKGVDYIRALSEGTYGMIQEKHSKRLKNRTYSISYTTTSLAAWKFLDISNGFKRVGRYDADNHRLILEIGISNGVWLDGALVRLDSRTCILHILEFCQLVMRQIDISKFDGFYLKTPSSTYKLDFSKQVVDYITRYMVLVAGKDDYINAIIKEGTGFLCDEDCDWHYRYYLDFGRGLQGR